MVEVLLKIKVFSSRVAFLHGSHIENSLAYPLGMGLGTGWTNNRDFVTKLLSLDNFETIHLQTPT
jgi:hypothetical protein